MVNTTELLENTIGHWGRWQVMFVILLYLSRFSVAYFQLMMVVQYYEPEFRCVLGSAKGLKEFQELLAKKFPGGLDNLNKEEQDNLKEMYKCPKGCVKWKFENEYYDETVVTQWELVCGDKFITDSLQFKMMMGIFLGNVFLVWFSDKFGRKKLLVVEIIVQVVAGTITAFMKDSLIAFYLIQIVAAIATGGMMLTSFVLLMDFVAKKYRTVIVILFHLPFQLGHASLGLIAYLLPHWSHIQLFCSLINLPLICYICLLPESIRWLVTKDRGEQVVKILEKAAKCNYLTTEGINSKVVSFMEQATPQIESSCWINLVSTKRMATKQIVLAFNWLFVGTVFHGVAQLMVKLDGDPHPFLNVIISGLAQVPGTFICLIICKVFGNKYSLIASHIVTSIPMFVTMALSTEPHWPFHLCECVSIMGSSMSFAIMYLYSVEIVPAVTRNIRMGSYLGCGSIGGMLAQILVGFKSTSTYIPYITFGILPVIAALLTIFFLPNTKNIEIPETVEEADQI